MRQTVQWKIEGMFCENCQQRIHRALEKTKGVIRAEVIYAAETAVITFDDALVSTQKLKEVIESLDYRVQPEGQPGGWLRSGALAVVILLLFLLLQFTGLLNRLVPGQLAEGGMGYGVLFVTGLLTSVHCIAMCGGINLSQSLPKEQGTAGNRRASFLPSLAYNGGRVCSYTLIGLILGGVGFLFGGSGEVGFPVVVQGVLKLLAGTVMILMGIQMLGLIPPLRRVSFTLPILRKLSAGGRRSGARRPFVVGLANGLMPCGPLQMMWVLALATGNPLTGALSMLAFSLGTVPLMLGLGTAVAALGRRFFHPVQTVGSVLVIVLGLSMFSQGGVLTGWLPAIGPVGGAAANEAAAEEDVQVVHSTLESRQYPQITVKKGIPVRWIIDAPEESITSCNVRMMIPAYEISHTFEVGENIIEFLPEEEGTMQVHCWMGMIYGSIDVVEEEGPPAEKAKE